MESLLTTTFNLLKTLLTTNFLKPWQSLAISGRTFSSGISRSQRFWQLLVTHEYKRKRRGRRKETPTSSKKFPPTQHPKKKDIPEISLPFSNFHSPHIAPTQNSESVAHYEQVRTLHSSNPLLPLHYFCFLNLYGLA